MTRSYCIYQFSPTIVEFIVYDDGCHLRRFAQHSSRSNVTPTAQKLSQIEVVVDKLHMEGHVDKWCKDNCDPRHFEALKNVSNLQTIHEMPVKLTYIHIGLDCRLILKYVSSVSPGYLGMPE